MANESPPQPTRRSIRKSAAVRSGRRLARQYMEWKSQHMYLGRYSVKKILAFEEYQRTTSNFHVFAVISLTPLPGLMIIVLLAAMPLRSPLLGITANGAFFVQSWLAYAVVAFSLLLFVRCALGIHGNSYSHTQSMVISLLTAASNEVLMLSVASIWEFPIPFRGILGVPPFLLFLAIWHVVVLGVKGRTLKLRVNLWNYLKLLSAQASILVIFQVVAILFMHVPGWGQAAITVGIPLLRAVLKRGIWRLSSCLEDVSTDTTVCVVEIFGSLFQNVCLQNARLPAVSALIIAVDFIQAAIETTFYLEHNFAIDGRTTIQTALKILENDLHLRAANPNKTSRRGQQRRANSVMGQTNASTGTSVMTSPAMSRGKLKNMPIRPLRSNSVPNFAATADKVIITANAIDLGGMETDRDLANQVIVPVIAIPISSPKQATYIDDVEMPHRHHAKILSQALQLVFASEVLVFVEYAEFACSVLYGLYTVILYHLPYADYNVFFIGLSHRQFHWNVANSFTYAFFEGLSMVLLYMLVRAKYGLSTFHQLAFVLEKYWMTVQGKMIGSLALIFIFSTVHQGVDLSLTFNWEKILHGSETA